MIVRETFWLVDLENTGKSWAKASNRFDPGDTVVIFWSNGTCDVRMKSLPKIPGINYMFFECCNGTRNAMDFQLCAWLGRMSALHPNARFRILSSDKGYTPLQKFLPGVYGVDVALLDPRCSPIEPAKANSVRAQYNAMLEAAGMSNPEDRRIMSAILMQTMLLPKGRRRLDTRYRLSARYGAIDGNLRYNAVKDVIKSIAEYGPWPVQDQASAEMTAPQLVQKTPETPQMKMPPVTNDQINRILAKSGIPLRKGQVTKAVVALTDSASCADLKAARDLLKKSTESIFMPTHAEAFDVLSPFLSLLHADTTL